MEEQFANFFAREAFGNTVLQWLIALGVTFLAYFILLFLRWVLNRYVVKLVSKTSLAWDDVVGQVVPKTKSFFLVMLAIYIGTCLPLFVDETAEEQVLRSLNLPSSLDGLIYKLMVIVLLIQAGIWLNTAVRFFIDRFRQEKMKQDPAGGTTITAMGIVIRALVWVLMILLALENMGVEIGPLLAGLGVGGIAIALAVQTVLKDLLASFSIILDKPFVVGDFIIVGDLMGSVEHIGIKTTRIRSLWGEQLVFSNNDLLESRIRNFGRMRERRVSFNLGVTYQTPVEKLAKVPGIIKGAIESQKLTRFDRSHFNKYGDFSLNFETVFYVGTPDFNQWMDIQQAINLSIHEEFEKEGIEFAYPTQTVFVVPENQEGGAEQQRTPKPLSRSSVAGPPADVP